MINELLKIIREAEDMIDDQTNKLIDFDKQMKKVHKDLKEISDQLNKANSKGTSSIKDK